MVVKTDVSIKLPIDVYGRIAPRSGLSLNNCIDIGAGVIDSNFRGNIGVLLINNSACDTFHVKVGDAIAQLILEKIWYPPIAIEVASFEDDDIMERGARGFGS